MKRHSLAWFRCPLPVVARRSAADRWPARAAGVGGGFLPSVLRARESGQADIERGRLPGMVVAIARKVGSAY